MKYNLSKYSLLFLLLTCLFTSCNMATTPTEEHVTNETYGTIKGNVCYQNSDDNSGIIVTLNPTNGLRCILSSNDNLSRFSGETSSSIFTITDKDGNYCFENIKAGIYTINAYSENSLESAVYTNITVPENETVIANDLKLTATSTISGKIQLDGTETNNYGFTIFIGGTSFMAKTNDSGNFKIEKVPTGILYEIYIEKGDFTYFWKKAELKINTDNDLGVLNFSSNDISNNLLCFIWKGSFATKDEIENPQKNWAYFNTTDGCSYIFDGTDWTLLASKGNDGKDLTEDKNISSYEIRTTDIEPGDSNLPAGGIKIEILKDGEVVETKYI